MLENTRPKLLQRLDQEFGTIRQLFTDSSGQQWQVALLPVLDEDKVHPARLYIKKDGGNKDDGEKDGQDRFVVDVNLSQFGPMQFDGLFKQQRTSAESTDFPTESRKHLGLLIRSHHDLPDTVRTRIGELFYQAMELMQMEGHVAFDVTPHFPEFSRGSLLHKALGDFEV